MDFIFSPEQDVLRDSVRRFREREYSFEQRRAIITSHEGFSKKHWQHFADLGWLGAGLSEDSGGFGGGPIETAIILEELGRSLAVEPLIGHVIATQALAILEPKNHAAALSRMLLGGERIVLAHLESETLGDVCSIASRVEATAKGLRLIGQKALVIGGAAADQFMISAREGKGISLFLVKADAPHLDVRKYRTLDNHRVADVSFDGVEVAETDRVGHRSEALGGIDLAIDHGIVALCAEAVGSMDSAMLLTRDYLRTRQQFGRKLSSFQSLQHRMADMLIETELAKSILYHALSGLASPQPNVRRAAVSAAKAQIGHAGLYVGSQAIQLHGAIGVTEEYPVGHHYKRLFVASHLFGNADDHRRRFIRSRQGGLA